MNPEQRLLFFHGMDPSRLRTIWLTGLTRRYHVEPGMAQTTGQHSWGVATLVAMLHPKPTVNLLLAALFHDSNEKFVGDMPAMTKWSSPSLADALTAAEEIADNAMGVMPALSTDEQRWLKACDYLEAILFCEHSRNLGNQYAIDIQQRLLDWFERQRKAGNVPTPVLNYVKENWDASER